MTKIEWTEKTWNPVTGCNQISDGCKNCYAKAMAKRLKAMGTEKYRNEFEVTLHPDELLGKRWNNTMVFVCSMSDLFHKQVPFSFIDNIMSVISNNPTSIFQILTKRTARMVDFFFDHKAAGFACKVPDNAWIGTTVENSTYLYRLDLLRQIDAKVRFISFEPLLGDVGKIDLTGIDWVIVGGESGAKARPMRKEWVLNIKEQCEGNFFFKQWGAFGEDGVKRSKKLNGKQLDGQIYHQMPKMKNQ